MTLIGIIAIFLVLIIIYRVSKASDLLGSLRGEERTQESRNNLHATLFLLFLIFGMGAAFWSCFHYAPLFLPEPSSEHGTVLRAMFQRTLWATVPVFVVTHILLFFFAWKYRQDKTKVSKFFPDDNRLELIWTLVPAVVMVFLVVDGLANWNRIMGPAPENAVVIEATGQQFYWTLRYAGKDNELGRKSVRLMTDDNPFGQDWDDPANKDDFMADDLYLPVGQPVLVKINSMDVLHNFFLPHFRVKMDAVPGIPTQFWLTPTKTTEQMIEETGNPDFQYELACAELCGKAHYNMKKKVFVVEADEFNKWKAEQEPLSKSFGPSVKKVSENIEEENEQQDINSVSSL